MLYDNETFLTKLDKLYKTSHSTGTSLFVQFKAFDGRNRPKPSQNKKTGGAIAKQQRETKQPAAGKTSSTNNKPAVGDPGCLIRATAGSTKISTVVKSIDSTKFHSALNTLTRANMYGLVRKASAGRLEKS